MEMTAPALGNGPVRLDFRLSMPLSQGMVVVAKHWLDTSISPMHINVPLFSLMNCRPL
jgi:hypothetical protein